MVRPVQPPPRRSRETARQEEFIEKMKAAGHTVIRAADIRAAAFARMVAEREARCTEIVDQVVPEYGKPPRGSRQSCTSSTAKRWQAAWDGACIALGGDPAEYRR